MQAPGSTMVMVTATTEIPTETEIVVNGMTITVTTVIPTTLVLTIYTHHFKHFINYKKNRTLIPSLAADTSGINSHNSEHASGGTIAGAVVGSVAGFGLLVGAALFVRRRYKRGMQMRQQQNELDNEDFYADPYQQNGEWSNQFANGGGYRDYPEAGGVSTAATASARGAPPAIPRHQNTYTAGPGQQLESMSDEYDEYGHPNRESFWTSLSQRFKSLRR
jgi:hypothetical protein